MKRQIPFLLIVLFFLVNSTGIFAEYSSQKNIFLSFIPSTYGISESLGSGYGFGEGTNLAKDTLLETGANSSKVTGNELWQVDIFAQWSMGTKFGVVLNFSVGPLPFAVLGYNADGEAVEGLSYSYLNMDIAALLSYNISSRGGIISTRAGPLLGFRLGNGQVILKSEDIISKYTVPGDQMLNASLGGIIGTGYALAVGSGFIDFGLKVTYHYSSVQGFLTTEAIPVNIITPSISIGYSLRGKK